MSIFVISVLSVAILILVWQRSVPRRLAEFRCYGGPLDAACLHLRSDTAGEYVLLEYRGHMYESFESPCGRKPLTMRHAGKVCL